LTVLALVPFVNKAFHIDDALFLRLAEQIRQDPLAPYAVQYNWVYEPESFWKVTQNPPLAGYVLAAAESALGTGESALRMFYIPLAAATMGLTWLLAARFCATPLPVTLLALFAPAFLVTASTVQADILLLFFWLLAVWLTVRAVDSRKPILLWGVGLVAAGAVITKYFGLALVPLLFAYYALRATNAAKSEDATLPRAPQWRPRWSMHVAALGIPLVVLAAWSIYSKQQSGEYHPLGAAEYSLQLKEQAHVSLLTNVTHVLAFFGGTMLWPVFLLPLGWKMPKWVTGVLLAAVAFLVWRDVRMLHNPELYQFWTWSDGAMYAAMTLAGAMVLAIGVLSVVARPDADSALLGLWLFGTFVFCALFNWTVSARIVLPCVLPALLLTVRWIETLGSRQIWLRWLKWLIVPAAAISLLVAFSDQEFANASRDFVRSSMHERRKRGETIYFAGHWGWQYYLESEGATAFNYRRQTLMPGDLVVFPYNNTANEPLSIQLTEFDEKVKLLPDVEIVEVPAKFPFQTMSTKAHSWFYASLREPLPYNFRKQPFVDQFTVARYSPELKGLAGEKLVLEHPHLFKNKRVTLRDSTK
jgi:hypothetical protein